MTKTDGSVEDALLKVALLHMAGLLESMHLRCGRYDNENRSNIPTTIC